MSAVRVPLTNGGFMLVDAEDLPLVDGYRWYCLQGRYAQTTTHPKVRAHRLILGAGPADTVDHINGDGLDNRRANLRVTTQGLNVVNAALRSDSSSGFKGVGFDRRRGLWRAYIRRDGRQRHLGYFSSPESAALAYNAAAQAAWGEYARLNEVAA